MFTLSQEPKSQKLAEPFYTGNITELVKSLKSEKGKIFIVTVVRK